jgi:hypothetical protein
MPVKPYIIVKEAEYGCGIASDGWPIPQTTELARRAIISETLRPFMPSTEFIAHEATFTSLKRSGSPSWVDGEYDFAVVHVWQDDIRGDVSGNDFPDMKHNSQIASLLGFMQQNLYKYIPTQLNELGPFNDWDSSKFRALFFTDVERRVKGVPSSFVVFDRASAVFSLCFVGGYSDSGEIKRQIDECLKFRSGMWSGPYAKIYGARISRDDPEILEAPQFEFRRSYIGDVCSQSRVSTRGSN